MRVAIVTETYPPEVNGVALTVAGLAHGLRATGHEVQLIRPRQPHVDAAAAPASEVLVAGLRLPRYPGLRLGLPARRRLYTLWQHARPDALYVATEGPLGGSALGVARRLGIPACTGFHTRFDEFARFYGLAWLTPLVRRYLRRFHRRSLATLVPTRELAGWLREQGFGNVALLSRAVDTRLFSPARRDPALRARWGVDADRLAVIHVGRIAAEKNLALAVRAFRAIQKLRPDARFVWVGDGPQRAALQAQHPDFVFCGMQKDEALAAHYASADLFLFPSLTETFGNVTLEALASGVPTVAFDYGAAREHLPADAGRRIPFGDADAFVQAACALAGDDAGREAMRRAARRAVADLDPQRVCASFAGLLAGLAQQSAP
jgi:glycosyltransferase involved in cell wall biosynthesis